MRQATSRTSTLRAYGGEGGLDLRRVAGERERQVAEGLALDVLDAAVRRASKATSREIQLGEDLGLAHRRVAEGEGDEAPVVPLLQHLQGARADGSSSIRVETKRRVAGC